MSIVALLQGTGIDPFLALLERLKDIAMQLQQKLPLPPALAGRSGG